MKHSFYGCENELERNYFARVSYFTHQKPVAFSPKFCHFFSEKFEELFVSTTGIKPSRKIGILMPNRDDSRQLYEPGLVSRLNPVLWIMPDYFDDISFCWQSKTGNMVKPTDEEFDLSDLECWLEGLKPVEYWKQVATEKNIHPFKISNLPFELKVFGFGVNTELRIYLKEGSIKEHIQDAIPKIIQLYNDRSEAKARKYGVVHNFKFVENEDFLCVIIDTGSAGVEIIKRILKSFAKISGIIKIEVDL